MLFIFFFVLAVEILQRRRGKKEGLVNADKRSFSSKNDYTEARIMKIENIQQLRGVRLGVEDFGRKLELVRNITFSSLSSDFNKKNFLSIAKKFSIAFFIVERWSERC